MSDTGNSQVMDHDRITCERVDREELDTRYLRGELAEADALAFEQHYFECDRCWRLVQKGVEVRAAGREAGAAATPARGAAGRAAIRWRRWSWIPVAAAAALAVIFVRGGREPELPAPGADVRSGPSGLSVTATLDAVSFGATWSRVADATSYEVVLYDTSGVVLWQRRLADTSITTPLDSIPGASREPLLGQVRALDLMGATIARSPLVDVVSGPSPR